MTNKLYNLARMTTATAGTGTITLGSAVSGALSFADAGVADNTVVSYGIKDGVNSEVGRGTYTSSGTTLSRDTVIKSTNSNNKISLSGSAEVYITALAEDINGYATKWDPDASPDSPHAMNDEFDDLSLDGKWSNNLVNLTAAENIYGLSLLGHSSGDSVEGIYQAVPSANYTVYAHIALLASINNYCQGGIGLFEDASDSAKSITGFQLNYSDSGPSITVSTWNSQTSWSGQPAGISNEYPLSTGLYLRIRCDNTGNKIYYEYSFDGFGWRNIYDQSYYTHAHVGIYLDNSYSSDNRLICTFFRIKNSVDAITDVMAGNRVKLLK